MLNTRTHIYAPNHQIKLEIRTKFKLSTNKILMQAQVLPCSSQPCNVLAQQPKKLLRSNFFEDGVRVPIHHVRCTENGCTCHPLTLLDCTCTCTCTGVGALYISIHWVTLRVFSCGTLQQQQQERCLSTPTPHGLSELHWWRGLELASPS